VCGRIRRLGAQPLVAPQVRTHKHGRPDRERDRGVAFAADRSNRECALQSCSVYLVIRAGSYRSFDGVEPLRPADELPGPAVCAGTRTNSSNHYNLQLLEQQTSNAVPQPCST
jgi:hypothetical protein